MKMGSMAIALIAEYGDCWAGAISLIGSSCSTRWPADASQAVVASKSPMSPMPQLVVREHEKSGIRMPERRARVPSVIAGRHRAQVSENPVEPLAKLLRQRQQAHDDI